MSIPLNPTRAVIYCRVSSKKQSTEASGLESQEHRCRQFAAERGYEVEAVFPDDVSGGGDFLKRTGMVSLLRYLDRQDGAPYVVVFDDLKRFARDTEFHLRLRRELQLRNATVECLNFRFEDTPEGKFVETVFAAQGQLEREQNARQVIQKMRARVEQGFWVFRAPIGYKYVKGERGGKELVRNEPLASVVQDALEGFATGRFACQSEVKRYLEGQPLYPKDKPNGEIRPMSITRLLRKAIYAGYVSAPEWGVSLRQGRHEPLISLATFERIQERMIETGYAATRKDINEDFPLRGGVSCASCGTPLTGGWSKGKYRPHAYYRCHKKGCEVYGKSIPRAQIEGRFEALLSTLSPSENLIEVAGAMFRDAWDQQAAMAGQQVDLIKADLKQIDAKIEKLVEAVVEASHPRVVAAYESRIEGLEHEKLLLQERATNPVPKQTTFDKVFELSMTFLRNPRKLWDSGTFEHKRTVLRLAFGDFLTYDREKGFLNTNFSLPFKALGGFSGEETGMVLPERFELSASPLPRECSTPELRQRPAAGKRATKRSPTREAAHTCQRRLRGASAVFVQRMIGRGRDGRRSPGRGRDGFLAGPERGATEFRVQAMGQDDRRSGAPGDRSGGASGKALDRISGEAEKDERTARLEQALRANLRRRKAQSRARAAAGPSSKDPDGSE